jgi:hypothetical protein
MFYEEAFIQGRWYWRSVPNGEWSLFDEPKLYAKIRFLEEQLADARHQRDVAHDNLVHEIG